MNCGFHSFFREIFVADTKIDKEKTHRILSKFLFTTKQGKIENIYKVFDLLVWQKLETYSFFFYRSEIVNEPLARI